MGMDWLAQLLVEVAPEAYIPQTSQNYKFCAPDDSAAQCCILCKPLQLLSEAKQSNDAYIMCSVWQAL